MSLSPSQREGGKESQDTSEPFSSNTLTDGETEVQRGVGTRQHLLPFQLESGPDELADDHEEVRVPIWSYYLPTL